MKLSKLFGYAKAIVAAATPVFTIIQAAVTDDVITGQEWTTIGVSVVVAIGVLMVPNVKSNTLAYGGTISPRPQKADDMGFEHMAPPPPYGPDSGPMPPSRGSSGPLE